MLSIERNSWKLNEAEWRTGCGENEERANVWAAELQQSGKPVQDTEGNFRIGN